MAVSLGNILSTNWEGSDEDDNDEDYVPSGAEESEEEPGDVEAEENNPKGKKKVKSKGKSKSRKRKGQVGHLEGEESDENSVIPAVEGEPKDPEKEKKKNDALWEDFLSDVTPPAKKNPKSSSVITERVPTSQSSFKESPKPQKVTITEVFEFAGETVIVKKEVDSNSTDKPSPAAQSKEPQENPCSSSSKSPLRVKRPGGVGAVLGQVLGKKSKLSTLEKSKLDWNTFKKEEGVEEVLDQYKKSKNGYLDRQAFLERTDFKQFEIEKNLRATNRSHRV